MKSIKLLSMAFLFVLAGLVACKDKDDKKEPMDDKKEDAVSKNLEIAKTFYPLFEKGDWAGIEKICAADFKDHNPMTPEGSPYNRDSLMHYLKATKEAFPDMKIEGLHYAGTDDMVFIHYRFTGTNTGSFMGQPATGKKVDYMGVDLVKFKDGVSTEHWDYGDNITYMKQMGMMAE